MTEETRVFGKSKAYDAFYSDTMFKLPLGRMLWLHLDKKNTKYNEEDKAKYDVTLIFPKGKDTDAKFKAVTDTINAMHAFAEKGRVEKLPKEKRAKASKLPIARPHLLDGDGEMVTEPALAGHWYLSVASREAPVLKDRSKKVIGADRYFQGAAVSAVVTPVVYRILPEKTSYGVSYQLDLLQLVKDGDDMRLVTGPDPSDLLDTYEDEEDGAAEAVDDVV